MGKTTIDIHECDRCHHTTQETTIGWAKIAVGTSPAVGISSEAHMCPECVALFTAWWERRAEFPVVETKIVGRVRAALGLDDILVIKDDVGRLVSANVATSFLAAHANPDLFRDSVPEVPVSAIKVEVAALVDEIVERYGLAKDGPA